LFPGTYDVLAFQAGEQLPPADGVGDAEAEADALGEVLGFVVGEAEGDALCDAEGLVLGVGPPNGFAITVIVRVCTPQPFAWSPGSQTSTVSFWIQVPMSMARQVPYPGTLKYVPHGITRGSVAQPPSWELKPEAVWPTSLYEVTIIEMDVPTGTLPAPGAIVPSAPSQYGCESWPIEASLLLVSYIATTS
jgi:hypothetical protein